MMNVEGQMQVEDAYAAALLPTYCKTVEEAAMQQLFEQLRKHVVLTGSYDRRDDGKLTYRVKASLAVFAPRSRVEWQSYLGGE